MVNVLFIPSFCQLQLCDFKFTIYKIHYTKLSLDRYFTRIFNQIFIKIQYHTKYRDIIALYKTLSCWCQNSRQRIPRFLHVSCVPLHRRDVFLDEWFTVKSDASDAFHFHCINQMYKIFKRNKNMHFIIWM